MVEKPSSADYTIGLGGDIPLIANKYKGSKGLGMYLYTCRVGTHVLRVRGEFTLPVAAKCALWVALIYRSRYYSYL